MRNASAKGEFVNTHPWRGGGGGGAERGSALAFLPPPKFPILMSKLFCKG